MVKIPGTYANSLLRIEIRLIGLKGTWNHLGYLHQIHAGATHPKGHYLSVHDQILQLANLAPYTVSIQFVPWVVRTAQSGRLTGSLRLYESGTKLSNADLSNLDAFHRQQMALVNPISITFPPEMDNSTKFSRAIAASLQANVSTVIAEENDDRTGLVLRNPGAYDVYLCLAGVATAATAIAVIEPNGYYELSPADYNGAVSVICPAGAGSIAGSELASASFDVETGTALGNDYFARLVNGALSVILPDGSSQVLEASGITAAYVLNGAAYASDSTGAYWLYQQPSFAKVSVDAANWPAVTSSGVVIA
jgi:hypothetical protein